MGVAIDSIEIEIQSNSANATKGIDGFISSLETLKKSGKLTTVTKNLNNLSATIKGFSDASRASSALGTLASAIEKLRSAGSISSQAKNLTTLKTALKSLETVDMGSISPKIKDLGAALAPLSEVKSGGFGTLVKSLEKIKDVTAKLDKDTIDAFANKIALLNQKLGPFAEKMATVKTAFNSINTEAKKAADSVEEFDEGINSSALNMSSFIDIARGALDVITSIINGYMGMVKSSIEWDGIAARFGRGFGAQAQETYAWIQRLNEEMGINIQQFMQYSSIYANMLQGFGVTHEDATKMALGYTELTYDIWAGYNDIYKNFEDASEAVKSAIAGEVEPIRRAGFTIVESTLEQTAANHGLEISLYNATEAQKSYLRYLALVDQAHAQGLVGTYAKELNTAEGMMRTLAQQWKSLKQSLGALFLPILAKIVPYVQAIVDLLKEAVHWLANLLGVEIQAVDFKNYEAGAGAIKDVANSAGTATDALDSATQAAKELKNATLGIDELNVISPNSSTGGSGGSGGNGAGAGGGGFAGLDMDSLWDETIFDTIQSDVDAIKEKLKGWLPTIASVAAALAGLRLAKLLSDIDVIEKSKLFSGKLSLAIGDLKNFGGWLKAFGQLAKEGGIIAALAAAFPKLSNALAKFTGNLGAFFALAKEGGVMKALAAAFPKIANALSKISSKFGIIGWIITAVIAAISFLVKNWEEMKKVASDFFKENIAPKFEEIKKHIDKLKQTLEPLTPVFKAVGVAVRWVGDVIGWLFEQIGALIVALAGGGLAGLFNSIVSIIEGFVQSLSGSIQIIRGMIELIVGIFTGDGEKIKEAWSKIWAGVKDVFYGLYDSTIGAIVEFVKGVINWFVKMWDELVGHSIVPDTINAIVDWFTSLPSKIFGSIEKFTTGIVDKFKGMWSKLVSWWNGKTKLKEYTPSIGSIYDKLKSRWDSARSWWNEKKTALKSYTPSIGSIYEKLSERWKNARDWWNGKKAGLSSYTPSIGSITDKLKSAWKSAKSWWSKNVGGLSTKLNVSVPTIKVKWETASAFGKSFKYPTGFSLKFAANGGIFDQGSLIWAGERGPEIMANAGGGKTGVMNIQQMSDAMYEAVYSATIAANRTSSGDGGDRVTKVYIDGREITSIVEKHQHESGASIMGNEVYSY